MPLGLSLALALAGCAQEPATAAPTPAPRLGLWHELVFHEGAAKLVLLNGGPEQGKPAADPLELWEWTGEEWRALRSSGPRWRNQACAAYDARRGVLVLYGGVQPGEDFADTWEWDGERWTEHAVPGPGPREAAGLAYDGARGVSVLFGGAERGELRGDTWTWDGTRWSRASAAGPSARFPAAFVQDAERELVLLFGGHTIDARGFRTHGDTWTWDGAAWQALAVSGPSARDGARAAWDPRGRCVLLFGGAEVGPGVRHRGDLWSWDGSAWSERADGGPEGSGPTGRVHAALAFDGRRGRLVLIGGSNAPGAVLEEVWEHDGQRWICARGRP